MLQRTPQMPRAGVPQRLTGVVNTVVGQITVMTADQLPETTTVAEPPTVGPRRMTKLETAQLMKDRHAWMSAVDGFTIEEPTEWNLHKERLKIIPNMSRTEKLELFGRLRRLALSYGIDFDEEARRFVMLPLPGDEVPIDAESVE